MTTKTLLEQAFEYFMEGRKDKSSGLGAVFNETYQRTGQGDDKYIAVSQLMLDNEYAFSRNEDGTLADPDDKAADVTAELEKIIGDDPN